MEVVVERLTSYQPAALSTLNRSNCDVYSNSIRTRPPTPTKVSELTLVWGKPPTEH